MDARNEYALRDEIVRIGKLMWEKNFIAAGDGNLSVRLGSDRILCTPSGLSKGFLNAEQLVIIDMQGTKVGSNNGAARDLVPSSEIRLHLECYRQRADVFAVVHAHPPSAISCTLVGISLATAVGEGGPGENRTRTPRGRRPARRRSRSRGPGRSAIQASGGAGRAGSRNLAASDNRTTREVHAASAAAPVQAKRADREVVSGRTSAPRPAPPSRSAGAM